jgi:hypothetical protein
MGEGKISKNPSLKRVMIKGLLLFLLITLLFGFIDPISTLSQVSAYNLVFPGRVRLPFGEKPDQAYNLSLYNLEAMFASHELAAGDKPPDEYRVLLIGDSSVWGYLLKPENTLTGYINAANITTADGQVVHAYNLGYPTMSLAKDLLILDYGILYEPDLIIWLVSLESFPVDTQLDSPLVQNNPSIVINLINRLSLNLDPQDSSFEIKDFWESTLIGDRRSVADLLRLQLYGVMWASTGIDQYYPESIEPPQEDFDLFDSFHGLQPPQLNPDDLSFDILSAGRIIVGEIPIILINEPIFISEGKNSDIRYNFFYPRWAYDQYRLMFSEYCAQMGWQCLDEWNLVLPNEFTNSAIHMTPFGTQLLASKIQGAIQSLQTP